MKYLLTATIVLFSFCGKAQIKTLNLTEVNKFIKAQLKTNDSLRKDNAVLKKDIADLKARFDRKDNSDDTRNEKIRNLEGARKDTLIGRGSVKIDSISKNKFAISIIK